MIYLKRILNLFLWPIRIIVGVVIGVAIYPFDLLAIPIYYVKTGHYYLRDFVPF